MKKIILEKLEIKGEREEDMSTIAERIGKELREGRIKAKEEGILQNIKETIARMIKMNFEDNTIKQVTGAKKSEIAKIRKEMSFN